MLLWPVTLPFTNDEEQLAGSFLIEAEDLDEALVVARRVLASDRMKRAGRSQRKESRMSRVRVLVGTKKGAFILTSDGKRKRWDVNGPHFGGWELYHLKASPVEPDRIYGSQTSSWFGQVIQRSDDGGQTWNAPGTKPEDLSRL